MIAQALKRAGIDSCNLKTVQRADLSVPSRYKSIRYFAFLNEKVVNGFYKVHSHEVVAVECCSLEPLWFSSFANDLCSFLLVRTYLYMMKVTERPFALFTSA